VRRATRITGPLLILVPYFALLAGAVWGLRTAFPKLVGHLPFGGIKALGDDEFENIEVIETFAQPIIRGDIEAVTLGFAILGAVALMLPISWVYFLTTRAKSVDQSFAQTMIVLPVIVAGIATIVQHSLALAFSLAGIVAAVRFRFTLSEPAHALYVFASITIGIAAGIGDLGIAYVLAIAFVATNLALWRSNYGADLTTPFLSFLTGRGSDDNEL